MIFSQKVFVNDNPLILTTDKSEYLSQHPNARNYLSFRGATVPNFIQAVRKLYDNEYAGGIIEDKSQDALLTQLHAIYHPIDAAGGVVFNESGDLLMIYRRGKWDLPKGKLDEDEDIEACALREVSEETGLISLEIESKVCNTFHIYSQDGEQLIKRTAWYKMKGSSSDKLVPQKEEKILEAKWVSIKELPALAAKSYEAMREVIRSSGLNF